MSKYVKAIAILTGHEYKLLDPQEFFDGLRALCKKNIQTMAPVPTKINIYVERWSKYRTNRQLRFLFGHYVKCFVDVTGYARHEALEEIKRECDLFRFEYVDYKSGEIKYGTRSLRDSYWTTKKLNELLVWLYEFIISLDEEMAPKMEIPYP